MFTCSQVSRNLCRISCDCTKGSFTDVRGIKSRRSVVRAAPMENGNTKADMTTEEETWEQKEEPEGVVGGGGPEEHPGVGGACEEQGAVSKENEEMMEEEKEEMPKVAAAPPDASKKENVNVVLIGHVDEGKSTIGGHRFGLPLNSHLDSLPNFTRSRRGPVRLPIVYKYEDKDTFVLGKLESGYISKAQQLVMMPNRHTVEVLSLQRDDVETENAAPGDNLKLRLKGIEVDEILPGFILCSPDNLCQVSRTFDAQIEILEQGLVIRPGYNAVLFLHTCTESVKITALYCLVDKKTGKKSKASPRSVKQGQMCLARLRTAGFICLETFRDFPQMGRFKLRGRGQTVATGKVLNIMLEENCGCMRGVLPWMNCC
ncbi:eukaryotic peptide chain release factor GTP-binding subunit ERF3A-like [Gouania willdenowi]|uniref:Eukaryotic peptide chain release factor GTP-binding subunit ERF3A-like n=1 Tax=Gouania willdenowi TaxID=441366 RepID=A0A8C5H5G3_GOUWI|nr:eukaryotic peptide chain release factor GTP-binding subunit ERF3A-like [Gouania willdenowi]